ncbi:MAG: hypothetical protein M1826_000419 [Phylliscum demangeonii]|nr:MAG: hypothetical protein M1826_000419 [Phylliscum demangeonii]
MAKQHDQEAWPRPGPQEDADGTVECRWDGDHDPMNPRSMSELRKWIIVLVVSLSSSVVACVSSIYGSTYSQLEKEFHCSAIVATLGLSLFVLGLGLGPMVLAPLSEFYGRRPIYISALVFFLIWLIPSAVARNIETMLVARFLDGVAGSVFLSVAGGTVGDLFTAADLQPPMMIYTGFTFLGPVFGPLLGGFINQFASWRWTFYVVMIWSGVMLIAICFVPETYHPVCLRRKAERLRQETGDRRWRAPIEKHSRSIPKTILWSIIRPFQLLTLEPMCFSLCLYSALLLGILYLFFGAFALVFEGNHDFQPYQTGLSFLGIFTGMLAGIATYPLWQKIYGRLRAGREAAGGEPGGSEPEYRLPSSIAGAVLVPIGLFVFGWTTYRSVPWIVPIVGSAIFGMGTLLVYTGVFTFLVDAYPVYAASALAANSFARSCFAAAFPLFGNQMYRKLGDQWASCLLALLAVTMMPFPYVASVCTARRPPHAADEGALVPVPGADQTRASRYLFFRYGRRLRGTSRFASRT